MRKELLQGSAIALGVGIVAVLVVVAGLRTWRALAPPPRSTRANLVLVVLDTVRRDHLQVYGYERPTTPRLQALAAQGTVFEEARSTSCWTLPAHASMFTGFLPFRHGADQHHLALSGDPATLARRLGDAGYDTAGISANPWVSYRTGLSRGFDHYRDLWRQRDRSRKTWTRHPSVAAARDWLDHGWDRKRPFFLFVNLMDAHGPYRPPRSSARVLFDGVGDMAGTFRRYRSIGRKGLVRAWFAGDEPVAPEALQAARRLYDAEIRSADAAMGEILDAVDAVSDPATTTVLVVTDHGENFGDHGLVGHAFSLHDTLVSVGLVARGPGFAPGARANGPVSLVDVFPTLLAAAGLRAGVVDGVSLTVPPGEDRPIHASYAWPEQVLSTFYPRELEDPRLEVHKRALTSAVVGPWKIVRGSDDSEVVYHLGEDPGETTPCEDVPAQVLDQLRKAAGVPSPGHQEPRSRRRSAPRFDDETSEALRALGYL
ncbi:MAG: sulfatase [Deltaproteobacteria bacterium]|nr:sulfatase [Deltaproteobacteria bacterium]